MRLAILTILVVGVTAKSRYERSIPEEPPNWLDDVLIHEKLQSMREFDAASQWEDAKNAIAKVLAGMLNDDDDDDDDDQKDEDDDDDGENDLIYMSVNEPRSKRAISESKDIPKWLTETQRNEIAKMIDEVTPTDEINSKIVQFFDTLPNTEQIHINTEYKKSCVSWVKKVTNADERNGLKKLYTSRDIDSLTSRLEEYKNRLNESERTRVNNWSEDCLELWQLTVINADTFELKRNTLMDDFQDWLSWLTDEQKRQLSMQLELYEPVFTKKVKKFFHQLPVERQLELKEKFKTKCTAWVKYVASEEEQRELKQLDDEGRDYEVKEKIKEFFQRLSTNKRENIGKFHRNCQELWNMKNALKQQQTKRTNKQSANKLKASMNWMTLNEKQEVEEMKAENKPVGKIIAKIWRLFKQLDGETRDNARKMMSPSCIDWMPSVVSNGEIDQLNRLYQNGDYDNHRRISLIYRGRLSKNKADVLAKMQGFCDDILYGSSHKSSTYAHLDEHLAWLSEEQKENLELMKQQGKTLKELIAKAYKYFKTLSMGKQDELKQRYKYKCMEWTMEIATEEEQNELGQLVENGEKNELRRKTHALFMRLPQEKRLKYRSMERICIKLWQTNAQERKRRRVLDHGTTKQQQQQQQRKYHWHQYIGWLNNEQIAKLGTMKAEGASIQQLMDKMVDFYNMLESVAKDEAFKQLKDGCTYWIRKVSTEDDLKHFIDLYDNNESKQLNAKFTELAERLTNKSKRRIEQLHGFCLKIWHVSKEKRIPEESINSDKYRRDISTDEYNPKKWMEMFLNWLTDEQKTEIKAMREGESTIEDIKDRIIQFYHATIGDLKVEATRKLQGACRMLIAKLVGEEKAQELKIIRESGDMEGLKVKVKEFMQELTDENDKNIAERYKGTCETIFNLENEPHHPQIRIYRDLKENNGNDKNQWAVKFLTWLTDDQMNEIKTMRSEDLTHEEIRNKVMEFYEDAEGDMKDEATRKLQGACRMLIAKLVGEEKAQELKIIRESGDMEGLKVKVKEFMQELTDENDKNIAERYKGTCETIFNLENEPHHPQIRIYRDLKENNGNDKNQWAVKFLTWLTDDQMNEIKTMRSEDLTHEEIRNKVMEFYEDAEGDVKDEATRKLQGACRMLIAKLVGEEKAQELKIIRESGDMEGLKVKVKEFMQELTDENDKNIAERYKGTCETIFNLENEPHHPQIRIYRDLKENNGNDKNQWAVKFLTWLTDDQMNEIKTMRSEDLTHEEIRNKVMEFYEDAEGDVKDEATRKLQGACRMLIAKLVGEEKAQELKIIRESGDMERLKVKVKEFMQELTDENDMETALQYKTICEKIFRVNEDGEDHDDSHEHGHGDSHEHGHGDSHEHGHGDSHEHGHGDSHEHEHDNGHKSEHDTHEEWMDNFLTWLTDDQKNEISTMYASGEATEMIRGKVMNFFDNAEETVKEEATMKLQTSCRSLVRKLVGEDETHELEALEESDDMVELNTKFVEFLEELADKKHIWSAEKYKKICKKVFDIPSDTNNRIARQLKTSKLANLAKSSLSWLTKEQMDELKVLNEAGTSDEDLRIKIMEFFEITEGDAREEASRKLQGGCRLILAQVMGREKAAEMKRMREEGAEEEELVAKGEEFLADITDPNKLKMAGEFRAFCKSVFGYGPDQARQRRELHHLREYSQWLTSDQKTELRELKEFGKSNDELKLKVVEFFWQLSDEKREKLKIEWKGICISWVEEVASIDERMELRRLHANKKWADLRAKINVYIHRLDDKKKQKVIAGREVCEKLFNFKESATF